MFVGDSRKFVLAKISRYTVFIGVMHTAPLSTWFLVMLYYVKLTTMMIVAKNGSFTERTCTIEKISGACVDTKPKQHRKHLHH